MKSEVFKIHAKRDHEDLEREKPEYVDAILHGDHDHVVSRDKVVCI